MSFHNNAEHIVNDTPLYNSRILNNYLEYLKKFYPDVDIQPILDYAGITIYELEDPAHWFNQHQSDRFHEILVTKTGQKDISREVGRFSASAKASGAVRQYTMGFVSPAAAYWVIGKIASNLTRAYHLKTRKLGTNKIEISAIPRPNTKMMPYQCDTLLGMLEAVPKLFTNKYAEIEHTE
ncbi:MAG: hypothetical protein JRJ85_08600, partial [Deltaproteobacteria bacterium]|nr:hypothetical protein [Deltaproteobacteria bacterium]